MRRTGAAVQALRKICERLCLQEFGGCAVLALRHIVGCLGIARHGERKGSSLQRRALRSLQGPRRTRRKALSRREFLGARSLGANAIRKRVAAGKGSCRKRQKTVCSEHGQKLRKAVVEIPVPVGHKQKNRRMLPAKLLLKFRKDFIRELARVGRRADDQKFIARKMTHFLPLPRQGKGAYCRGTGQRLRRSLYHGLCILCRPARRAEIQTVNLTNLHAFSLAFTVKMTFSAPIIPCASPQVLLFPAAIV